MTSVTKKLKITKRVEPEIAFRGRTLLKARLEHYPQDKDNLENFSTTKTLYNSKSKKLEILSKVSRNYLKKSLASFSYLHYSKAIYTKAVKNFYKGYKLSLYTALFLLNLKLTTKIEKFNHLHRHQNLFSKYYFKRIYPNILFAQKLTESFFSKFNFLLNKLKKQIRLFTIVLNFSYKKNLRFYSLSSILLTLFYQLDNTLLTFIYKLKQTGLDQLNSLRSNKEVNRLLKNLENQFTTLNKVIVQSKTNFLQIFLVDKKQITAFLGRVGLMLAIYSLPFVFLGTQALIPVIDEYEYLVVNPFANIVFSKIPFLIDLLKSIKPLISNPMLLFWAPLAYYLGFIFSYRSGKISYKVAFNGSIAAIFLVINYSWILVQFLTKLSVFNTIKLFKDLYFTSFLIKYLGRNENGDREEALKVFANLVRKHDSELRKYYFDFILAINHRVFSHLALITLAALVYNCIYYIIHNKNPEILLVTKTALATIKNPPEKE